MARISGILVVVALVAAACGGTAATPTPTVAPTASAAPTTAATPTPTTASTGSPSGGTGATVSIASTSLGDILVGADGLTLYGFTPDEDAGKPTCNGDCAALWPPLTVTGTDFTVGTGLEQSEFKLVARDDGTMQLAVDDYPLYWYTPDDAAGDVKGQGLFDKWYVVGTDGELIGEPGASGSPSGTADTVSVASTSLGDVLVGSDGLTLYGFTPDEDAGKPTCNGDCAALWPPLTVTGTDFTVGTGLDQSKFKLVARDDGTMQLAVNEYPLYWYTPDDAAGDVKGQGLFDKWYVVGTDGELNKATPSPSQ